MGFVVRGHLASLLGTTGNNKSGETITLDTGHTVNVPDLAGNGGWQQYSDQVQAVVDLYGPADFTTNFANSYKSVKALLGGNDAFSVPDQARLAMPGTYASPDDPPFSSAMGMWMQRSHTRTALRSPIN